MIISAAAAAAAVAVMMTPAAAGAVQAIAQCMTYGLFCGLVTVLCGSVIKLKLMSQKSVATWSRYGSGPI